MDDRIKYYIEDLVLKAFKCGLTPVNIDDLISALQEYSKLVSFKDNRICALWNGKSIRFNFADSLLKFSKQNQRGPLYKALKKEKNSTIIDATAGSGKDLALLTSWGFKIIAFERHPLIFLLLLDSLASVPNLTSVTLEWGNVFQLNRLKQLSQQGRTVVYYDPMYPVVETEKKSALPRQDIQFFRELIGEDRDIISNLNLARSVANKVILKRALKSKQLDSFSISATHSFCGKNTRYDLFIKDVS